MNSIKEIWIKNNIIKYKDVLLKEGPIAFYTQFACDYINNHGLDLVEMKPMEPEIKRSWRWNNKN